MATFIYITLETEAQFTPEELWPDGGAPDPITKEAVEALIAECGGPRRILGDWGMEPLTAAVSVMEVAVSSGN